MARGDVKPRADKPTPTQKETTAPAIKGTTYLLKLSNNLAFLFIFFGSPVLPCILSGKLLSISDKTPKSVHATSGSIEPIIPPAIKGGKLGQYLRAVILAISPTDPMAIAAYDANFF
jgi:hypothetical protein